MVSDFLNFSYLSGAYKIISCIFIHFSLITSKVNKSSFYMIICHLSFFNNKLLFNSLCLFLMVILVWVAIDWMANKQWKFIFHILESGSLRSGVSLVRF